MHVPNVPNVLARLVLGIHKMQKVPWPVCIFVAAIGDRKLQCKP